MDLGIAEEAILSQSKAALCRGETDEALALLSQISVESSLYIQATIAKADIFLNSKHDKSLFIECYLKLSNIFGGAEMNMMLGEAWTKIGEPEHAIKSYEAAIGEKPNDMLVARKFGKALISMHAYCKAIEHYESTLSCIEDCCDTMCMKLDLAGKRPFT